MKRRKLYFASMKVLLTLMVLFALSGVRAQTAQIYLANDLQVSPTAVEFDVFIKSNSPSFPDGFPYGNGQFKITFNLGIKPVGSTVTFEILPYVLGVTSDLTNQNQVNNTLTQPGTLSYVRIPARVPVPYAEASTITAAGTKIIRMRMNCTAPYVTGSLANLGLTIAAPSGSVCSYVVPAGTVVNITGTALTLATTCLNAPLNQASCANPVAQTITTSSPTYCASGVGVQLGLANSQVGVGYTLYKDGVAQGGAVAGTGTALTPAPWAGMTAGVYTVSGIGTGTDPCPVVVAMLPTAGITINAIAQVNPTPPVFGPYCEGATPGALPLVIDGVTGTWAPPAISTTILGPTTYVFTPDAGQCANGTSTIVMVNPGSTVEETVNACGTSFVWPVSGATYTASGDYTFVAGCVTNILHLTLTPNTTVEETVNACGTSFVWPVSGATYTASGDYTFVAGCVTNILHLTLTPNTTVEETVNACGSAYTWTVSGATYTASGDYTFVAGCVTNILHLTLTPSTTVEETVSACGSTYTWTVSGATYTASGDYTFVAGCVTNILHLTLTPNTTVEETVSACGSAYTWTVSGATYTASGDYTFVAGCVTNILHLTLTPNTTVEETVSACGSTYTWTVSGATYTASGDYTFVAGCVTNILHLTLTPNTTVEVTASACDSYYWAVSAETYTVSGDYTFVVGCVTNILHLTITPSGTNNYNASACDSYYWAVSAETYTVSGDYTFVNGCSTNILHLIITPSSTVEFTASACDSYTWTLSGETYTTSGDKTFVVGCVTNILHLTITPTVMPAFAQLGPYVQGSVPGILAGTSLNGISGIWSPATISTANVGVEIYTFTPDAGQCAIFTIMNIEVTAIPCNAVEEWNGSVNNDWFTAANWTPAAVPCATTAVTIPVAPLYPTLTSAASCASIVIETGASFIGSEFLTTGNAVVEQLFPLTGYHYISSPVQATTFNAVFPLAQNAVWAYLYDEPSGNWVNQFIGDPLGVGVGYSVRMDVPQTATFAGALNASPVQKDLSMMNPSGIAYRAGWNLFGNPFTSAIDWDQVTLLGADAAVYVWNGSVYKSYVQNLTGDPGFEDGLIPSMNGFFVHSNSAGNSIIVGLQARTHSSKLFYKESVSNMLSLRADANTYSDGAVVSFNDNATAGFDAQYDAYKLTGIEQAPKLYSMTSGDILSINSLPMLGNEVVNLGFKCGVNGTYSISSTGMASFDATTPILLEDLKTGTIQDLRISPAYSFDYNTADNENRFKLHFKSANSVPSNSLSGINIYSAVRTIVINNTTTLAGEVKIYDLTGRELKHTTMSSQNTTNIPVNFAVGTYLVKVITEKGVASNKVFIR